MSVSGQIVRSNKKKSICDICMYVDTKSSHLKEHIQSKHYGIRFLCEFMTKTFRS